MFAYPFSTTEFSERYTKRGFNFTSSALPPKRKVRQSAAVLRPKVVFTSLKMYVCMCKGWA
jgi:hypothetical protein